MTTMSLPISLTLMSLLHIIIFLFLIPKSLAFFPSKSLSSFHVQNAKLPLLLFVPSAPVRERSRQTLHGLSSDDTLGPMVKQSGGVIVPSEVNQPNTEIVTHMFKSFLTKELGITEDAYALCEYNSSMQVIVDEFFKYEEREVESTLVVNDFKRRQKERSASTKKANKSINPVVAIPGAPGSGKSTFLAHFPDSKEYLKYCKTQPPIVAPLSFNGAMTEYLLISHTFGLRILFGAAMAMRSSETVLQSVEESSKRDLDTASWESFIETFEHYKFLSATGAVRVLKNVYGADRRILVLVDELSKAAGNNKGDDDVMREVGALLDGFGDVDVIVSSLSPQYIDTLMTGYSSIQFIAKCFLKCFHIHLSEYRFTIHTYPLDRIFTQRFLDFIR